MVTVDMDTMTEVRILLVGLGALVAFGLVIPLVRARADRATTGALAAFVILQGLDLAVTALFQYRFQLNRDFDAARSVQMWDIGIDAIRIVAAITFLALYLAPRPLDRRWRMAIGAVAVHALAFGILQLSAFGASDPSYMDALYRGPGLFLTSLILLVRPGAAILLVVAAARTAVPTERTAHLLLATGFLAEGLSYLGRLVHGFDQVIASTEGALRTAPSILFVAIPALIAIGILGRNRQREADAPISQRESTLTLAVWGAITLASFGLAGIRTASLETATLLDGVRTLFSVTVTLALAALGTVALVRYRGAAPPRGEWTLDDLDAPPESRTDG